jgi:hypothetical protein
MERREYAGYSVIAEDSPDWNGATEVLETTCVAPCQKLHCIDDQHPDYIKVLTALEKGDRSLIFCYHTCPNCRESMWNCQCRKVKRK